MSEEEKCKQLRQVYLLHENGNEDLWKKISDLEAKLTESEKMLSFTKRDIVLQQLLLMVMI